ncbi:MAG: DUF3786 domain-containing protein [Proteobacteria bacterium]|nr:DUF3786 domain-containing protein [Pseudomonadota bacterium]MBU1737926.1 DUF3786 domain-containing protein [Pseudomonadota bacterium]
MNPLAVVARTPKNNCGECGYPTCLAFAASVVSTGTDPEKCPYINLEGLVIETSGVALENAAEERDLALVEHLKGKIADLDFAVLAPQIGATYLADQGGTLRFPYLGQDVLLSRLGILLDGADPEDPRDQILLYNYVHSGGGILDIRAKGAGDARQSSGRNIAICGQGDNKADSVPFARREWIGMESMPNSISKVRTLATYGENPLADLFSGRTRQLLIEKAALAGGIPCSGESTSLAIEFQVLPMIPQRILFWEEESEDGFPAKVKILYDTNALDYLDIESLLFSSERLAERLRDLISGGDQK